VNRRCDPEVASAGDLEVIEVRRVLISISDRAEAGRRIAERLGQLIEAVAGLPEAMIASTWPTVLSAQSIIFEPATIKALPLATSLCAASKHAVEEQNVYISRP
jgi:hypothetical protein